MTTERLTGVAAEIADLIGRDAALRLFTRRGGTEVKLPERAAGSLIADIVGEEAAELLILHYGAGHVLTVPMGNLRGQAGRRARAVAMLHEGRSAREVALECEMHVRTVRNIRRALAEDLEARERAHGIQLDLGF